MTTLTDRTDFALDRREWLIALAAAALALMLFLPALTSNAFISEETLAALDQYRRFRHVVRNVYTLNLEADRIHELAKDLPRTLALYVGDVRSFVAFLRGLGDTD